MLQWQLGDQASFNMLECLVKGSNIAEAYLSASSVDPDFDLPQFLSFHLFDGTFCELSATQFIANPD